MLIDLDHLLPVQELVDLHLPICYGIAKSTTYMSSRVIPHHEANGDLQAAIAYKEAEGPRIYNVADESADLTPAERRYYEQLDHEQKKRFLQLTKSAYYDGEYIILRFPLFKHRTDQFATFEAAKCRDYDDVKHFPELMKFIHRLPFDEIGRVLIFLSFHHLPSDMHYDRRDDWYDGRYHFIWFNPTLEKKFFLLEGGQKRYITSRSAFFDFGLLHGADPAPKLTYSIRVDGQLTREFCERTGIKWKPRNQT